MYVDTYWSHSFIADLIRPDGIVFDIGVNDGGFAVLMAPRCRRVIGFEPDARYRSQLKLPANVSVYPSAIAASRGTYPFHVNTETCASLHYTDAGAVTEMVEAITLEDALAMVPEGVIDLIKMDIEGEEMAVLSTAPAGLFSRIAQITVEFHDFLDPSSLPQIDAVIQRMRGLGYRVFRFSRRNHGDMLFLHGRLVPMGPFCRMWILLRFKHLRGLFRMLHRVVKI